MMVRKFIYTKLRQASPIFWVKKSLSGFFIFVFLFQLFIPLSVYAQAPPDDEPSESTFGDLGDDLSYPYYSEGSGESCSAGGSGGGGGDVAQDFTLGPIGTEEQGKVRRVALISALMADYGLTPEQASGPVGNFMHESGGFDLPPDVNEGGSHGPPSFSGGYGWAQWTAGRQDTFIAFAVERGYMASPNVNATDAANYAYFKKELNESYQDTITELKNQRSPEDAAVSFEATFERAGTPILEARKRNARQAFEEYQELGGAGGCGVGACTDDGKYCFPLKIESKGAVHNPEMFQNNTAVGGHDTYTAYDILVDEGTEVVAFMSGRVVQVGEDRCPGRYVTIFNQEENVSISYMHMKYDNHVEDDQEVQPGEHVGISGNTQEGCTVPHLHIDSIDGDTRYGCSRLGCDYAELFNDIGPQLYETFQKIPD